MAGKPYAAFATGGRGGGPVIATLDRLCSSFKFKKAVEGVAVERSPSPKALARCKEAGKELAMVASKK